MRTTTSAPAPIGDYWTYGRGPHTGTDATARELFESAVAGCGGARTSDGTRWTRVDKVGGGQLRGAEVGRSAAALELWQAESGPLAGAGATIYREVDDCDGSVEVYADRDAARANHARVHAELDADAAPGHGCWFDDPRCARYVPDDDND